MVKAKVDPFVGFDEPKEIAPTCGIPAAPPPRRVEIVKKGRHYQHPETGELFPSVTNILGATPKPALVRWAANLEREICIEAAANLYEDAPTSPKMSRPSYITTLNGRLGKERAHQKALTKAGEIGTQIHNRIEWAMRKELLQKVGPEPVLQEKALWAFMAWEDWRATTNLAPLAIEQTVWSMTHKYAGMMDLYAELDITEKMLEGLDAEQQKKIEGYLGTRQRILTDWKSGKAIYGEAILQNAAYCHALVEMGHADMGVWGLIVRLPKVETDPDFEVRLISPTELAEKMSVFLHVKAIWQWQKAEDDNYWAKRNRKSA